MKRISHASKAHSSGGYPPNGLTRQTWLPLQVANTLFHLKKGRIDEVVT